MKRTKIIYGLICCMFLLGSSVLNTVPAYAYNYDDEDNDYYYNNYNDDEDNNNNYDYYYWKNYWENKNRYNNENNQNNGNNGNNLNNGNNQNSDNNQNNDNTINQDNNNQKNNYYDDEDDDYISEPEKPKIDMTNVTLEKEELEGLLISNENDWDNSLEFKIKVNSEVVLNPVDDDKNNDEDNDEDSDEDNVEFPEENTRVSVESSNEDMYFDVYLRNNVLTITTNSEGKTTLKLTINDKVFKIKVKIKRVGFKEQTNILVKGKSKDILTAGSKKYNIKLKSSKPSIVSVSKTGKVKALKEGNAIITGEINGKKMYALVSSVSEVRKKAIDWARSYVEKSEYSQPKRMQKGFYDCSSLVWRAYNKFGINLGGMNYAPTAAELCRTYDKKKRTMSDEKTYKKDNVLSFLPGDLMFFSGEKNGRYKNIYHVEMISGLYFYGLDRKGKPDIGFGYIRVSPYGDLTYARVEVK